MTTQGLESEKRKRYRLQLLAAVIARYFWIALSVVLLNWFQIPFATEISLAAGALALLNTLALFSFLKLRYDRLMVYAVVAGDNLALLYAVAATGLFTSPFITVLIVDAALTVLITDFGFGVYAASIAALGYCVMGALALTGQMPPALNIPQVNWVMALLHMVVLTTALFTIVGILGYIVLRLQRSENNLAEQGRLLQEKNQEMSADLAIAATVQKAIQSRIEFSDDRLAVYGKMKPMLEVGGDYFEIFHFETGEIGIFVADVSGHGAGSALITAMLKVSVENAVKFGNDVAALMGRVNDDMCRIIGATDFYLTGMVCKINPQTMVLEYCGAAHPEVYLLSETEITALESEGTILGKLPSVNFPVTLRQLGKGNRLLVYTDGITEARHGSGEFWGEERLREMLLTKTGCSAREFTETVFSSLQQFDENHRPNDDRTLVTVDILATAGTAQPAAAAPSDMVHNVDLGRRLLLEGNLDNIEQFLRSQPDLPLRATIALIRSLRRGRGNDAALHYLQKLQHVHGQHPILLEELGRHYLAAGNTAEAKRYFRQAQEQDTTGYSSYYLAKFGQ